MNWPSHTDYQDSIQNPHICFEDAELKESEVKCDMLGLPKVMSGNFASVYSVKSSQGRYAIRCFVRQVLGQQGRYARMSQQLLGLGLSSLVGFEYILRGIKVRNEWYPVVKMQWVEGLPLNQHLEEIFDKPDLLNDLAKKLRVVMKGLRDNQLAHGDLQHGNVMVTPDNEIRLVDYDGMYTPAFRGKAPELGHANFQHPRRTSDFYNEDLDNFGALVIHTSLLGLASDPTLFKDFYTGDNLLFLSSDYKNPGQSKLLKRLKENKDDKVKKLAELFERICLADVAKVPVYEDVMVALENGTMDTLISAIPAGASAAPATAGAAGAADGGWWAGGTPPESEPLGSRPATGSRPSTPSTPVSGSRPSPAPTPKPAPAPAAKPAGGGLSVTPTPTPAWSSSNAPKPSVTAPRTAPSVRQPQPAQPTPTPAPAGANNMKLWLILGGIGILVFIVFFLLAR
jgi:hypothetical protein